MRVTVFGAGGVGGYLAVRLAASPTADVSVIARGAHLRAIQRDGLHLQSTHGNAHVQPLATEDPADVGVVDVVLLTVKSTDVPAAAERLEPLVGSGTAIITFQNGVDSPRQVARVVGRDRVLPGVAYIFSTVAAPGVVRHTAGPGRFLFGAATTASRSHAKEVGDFLATAGVDVAVVDDVDVALWSKFMIISATAGVTAASRLPIDILREDVASLRLCRVLVEETADVGRASGVALGHDSVDRAMEFITSIGPGAYSSLLYDLVNGKPMELEALHGAVVRLADEAGIDVPATRTIHALLSPWARRNTRFRGAPDPSDGTYALTSRTDPRPR